MSRYFKDISLADFKIKIQALYDNDDGFLYSLSKEANKDINKVEFDFENYEPYSLEKEVKPGDGFLNYPIGFVTLPNGMHAFFINAGGDWEMPVCFLLYWDGSTLRGYIPKDGNVWNRKAKSAYGNDEESDEESYPSLVKESAKWLDQATVDKFTTELENNSFSFDRFVDHFSNHDAVINDVQNRIVKK